MLIVRNLVVSIVFFLMTGSFANATTDWQSQITVEKVQGLADGGFIIYAPTGTDSNCPDNGRLFYLRNGQNGQTSDGIKTALSIVLLAFTTSKTITFSYNGASTSCYVSSVVINP
ncbi:hypothetical protein A9Q99_09820 [Gammaproteobacteria bacterium 45_16_T64]|nr:hypothetical protein A9Q99_09820 [Gammaproteobacteria bacterium 45_16_T64]